MTFHLDPRRIGIFSLSLILLTTTATAVYFEFLQPKTIPAQTVAKVSPVETAPHMDMHDETATAPAPPSLAAISLLYSRQTTEAMMSKEDGRMNMTTPGAPLPGDEDRANSIQASLHQSLDKYADVNIALAAGFYPKAAKTTKLDAVYHFKTTGEKDQNKLDPEKPSALLYQRQSDGNLHLVGVMFVGNLKQTLQTLNDNFYPLSQTVWHQHLDTCKTQDNSQSLGVHTKSECDALGGVFRTSSDWMTHMFMSPLEATDSTSMNSDMAM